MDFINAAFAAINDVPNVVVHEMSLIGTALTFHFSFRAPTRPATSKPTIATVQFILRHYTMPEEVVLGFDLDMCACYIDPTTNIVYVAERCARFLQTKINYMDWR